MDSLLSKEYFGVVGYNRASVKEIYNCLANKVSTKVIASLDSIQKTSSSLGAIALTPSAYIRNELGIEISCLYQRYQKLRIELLPINNVQQVKQLRSARY